MRGKILKAFRPVAVLILAPWVSSCGDSSIEVSEIFWFDFHLEEPDSSTGLISIATECATDGSGLVGDIFERESVDKDAIEAMLSIGEGQLEQCAPRWRAVFDSATTAVSEVEITSGDRSETSSSMTATLKIGALANDVFEVFEIAPHGRLTAVSLTVTGPIRSSDGTAALWRQCTAQFSFQEDDVSRPESIFEASVDDFCQIKYTIFDDASDTAGGKFKLMAKNVFDEDDGRLLIIPDGAFSLDLD